MQSTASNNQGQSVISWCPGTGMLQKRICLFSGFCSLVKIVAPRVAQGALSLLISKSQGGLQHFLDQPHTRQSTPGCCPLAGVDHWRKRVITCSSARRPRATYSRAQSWGSRRAANCALASASACLRTACASLSQKPAPTCTHDHVAARSSGLELRTSRAKCTGIPRKKAT